MASDVGVVGLEVKDRWSLVAKEEIAQVRKEESQ